jgi:hypothetical protein
MVTIIKRRTSKKEIEQRIKEVISKLPKNDILKFAGKLKTDLDPSLYQMQMRNEWE